MMKVLVYLNINEYYNYVQMNRYFLMNLLGGSFIYCYIFYCVIFYGWNILISFILVYDCLIVDKLFFLFDLEDNLI